ncbi:MAG: F0F1 ATP synthase subunit epsilon [Bacillota bacterium]
MNLIVFTPEGELYNETLDYVVVSSKNNGEFAILDNHAPLISTIDVGYVKMVKGHDHVYSVVINGALENRDSTVHIIAQEAHIGLNKDSALEHLNAVRKERLEENRKRTQDFLKAERELKKNIKNAQASKE